MMKKNRLLLLLCLMCLSTQLSAQQDKVLEIREYYQYIKSHTETEESDSIRYYCDRIVRNTHDMPWRAIGIFSDTITFWYSDLMEAANMDENTQNDSAWALVLVTSSSRMSQMTSYREWLFKDGKMIFHYDKMDGYDEESTWEYRYYFNNNKLIRFMQGGQIISFEGNPADILGFGNSILTMFSTIVSF